MNDLQVFDNSEFGRVRSVRIEEEPWFVGKDVAEALGYSNPRKALSDHVVDEDKGVTKCDTLGGKQELTIINESGLYALIFGSKLESAKRFKRWVTSEVLPSIRKTGKYSMSKEVAEIREMEKKTAYLKEVNKLMRYYKGDTRAVERILYKEDINIKTDIKPSKIATTDSTELFLEGYTIQEGDTVHQTYVNYCAFCMENGLLLRDKRALGRAVKRKAHMVSRCHSGGLRIYVHE